VTLPVEETGAETITRVHREEWARVVAALTRRFGDLDIAEEMAAEAFAIAVERWPTDGVPPNPGAWITTSGELVTLDEQDRGAWDAALIAEGHWSESGLPRSPQVRDTPAATRSWRPSTQCIPPPAT
jgi:predicted RNA polymerase sigma factor